MRALGVIVMADRTAAKSIPPDFLIDMLHSGTWTDRNKSGMLLDGMTFGRDPALLRKLRARAVPSLIEMARWKERGHAGSFRMILGRIAGIQEARLEKLADSGDLKPILDALHRT